MPGKPPRSTLVLRQPVQQITPVRPLPSFHTLYILTGVNPLHDFFQPSLAFVLSTRVKNALGEMQNVQFLPAKFIHVVSMSAVAGDFSTPRQTLDLEWIPSFLRSMPDCLGLHPINPYYELVVPNPYRAADFQDTSFRVTVTLPHVTGSPVDILLSKQLLDECPVFWSSKTVFRREVFDVLDSISLLDPDYFTWSEFEV